MGVNPDSFTVTRIMLEIPVGEAVLVLVACFFKTFEKGFCMVLMGFLLEDVVSTIEWRR